MAVPTAKSRGDVVSQEVLDIHRAIVTAREIAVTWQANLLSNTPVSKILNGIYLPYAAGVDYGGIWRTLSSGRTIASFLKDYLTEIEMGFEFGPADVFPAQDGIEIGENNFSVDDPVDFIQRDTLPAPLLPDTTYFIQAKPTPDTVRFSATQSGAAIDITSQGAGLNVLRFNLGPELTALETALEAVIDEIILVVPQNNPGNEILAQTFDKNLAASTTGLADEVLTPAQTATLRARLLDVENAIEAPA